MGDDDELDAHRAAQVGDLEALMDIEEEDWLLLLEEDSNGWTPLMEAVRYEHVPIVEYLLQHGADVSDAFKVIDLNMQSYHELFGILKKYEQLLESSDDSNDSED